MQKVKDMLKIMKKLDKLITDYSEGPDDWLIDPLTELQEKIQETIEVIKTEIKGASSHQKDVSLSS